MTKGKNPRGVFEKEKGSGVWWINYHDAEGRRHRERVGPKSLAIDAYRLRKTDIRIGRAFPELQVKRTVPFAELAKDALVHAKSHHSRFGYVNSCLIMNTLLEWFGQRAAKDIRSQEIEGKLLALTAAGRAPSTVNHYRSLLGLTFSLGMKQGKVAANPIAGVHRRRENNGRIRFLEPPEEEAIREKIRELSPEHESEMDLSLNTGMRRAEQYRLRKADVDLERGIITITKSKNGEMRHIPINANARIALEDLMSRSRGAYVVAGRSKAREDKKDHRDWLENAVKAAGVKDFRYHDLRHTFASRLVMAGVDLRTVQELMGHKGLAMTLRYSHLAPSHLGAAVERLVSNSHQNNHLPKVTTLAARR